MIDHIGNVFLARNSENSWSPVEVPIAANISGYPDTGFPRGFMEFAPLIAEAIREGRDSIEYAATFEDGLKVQRVQDAARESNATGQAVVLR